MHTYIYDSFLQDKKYEKNIVQLENRVTDIGINGYIHKLSILKSLREIVQDEINVGATTIVVVGNDSTVSQIIDIVAKQNITLGIIPIGPENVIAASLGISATNAVENLSKRIVQKLDLGKANDIYFLSSLQITNTNAIIECGGYIITPRFGNYNIDIYNFILNNKKPLGDFSPKAFSPLDGALEAIVYKAGKHSFLNRLLGKKRLDISTFLPFQRIKIKKPFVKKAKAGEEEKEDRVLVDGQRIIKTPITIEAAPSSLKVIVGKNRVFGDGYSHIIQIINH